MIDPMNALGLASAAMNGISQGAVDSLQHKQSQKTIRTQSRMAAFSDASQCFSEILSAYQRYQAIASEERVKRDEIRAWEKQNIADIRAKKEYVLAYLERSFSERSENFSRLFDLADKAIGQEDVKKLGLVLSQIVELAKTSPFHALADISLVQKALDDPQHEWKF